MLDEREIEAVEVVILDDVGIGGLDEGDEARNQIRFGGVASAARFEQFNAARGIADDEPGCGDASDLRDGSQAERKRRTRIRPRIFPHARVWDEVTGNGVRYVSLPAASHYH